MATLLNIIVLLSLTVGICAGSFCDEYGNDCNYGCCTGTCCNAPSTYNSDLYSSDDDSLNSGAWIGIVLAAVIFKVCFWVCCCYFVRRRRQTVLVQHVMSPQTSVTVSQNQSHAGYDQQRPMPYATPMPGQMPNAMPMPGPMPNGQYTQQQMGPGAPPPYEQPSALPPPK